MIFLTYASIFIKIYKFFYRNEYTSAKDMLLKHLSTQSIVAYKKNTLICYPKSKKLFKAPFMKKKVHIEYPINPSSSNIIWGIVSTAAGLQRWFADQVSKAGKTYTFQWGKTEVRTADVINSRAESFIRFHWTDEEPKTYFEFKLHYDELTTNRVLEVTDFADEGEEEDVKNLWNSQIDVMRRTCGL